MRNYWRVIAAVVAVVMCPGLLATHRYIAKYPDNPPTRRGTSGEDWGQLY